MPDRILDFSEEPAYLSVRYSNLVIRRPEKPDVTMPLSEVAVVVASSPGLSCSLSLLAGVCAAGGAFIACDASRLPIGMMLPLQSNGLQTERFARQAAAKLPLRKRLWREIVREKIRAQASLLLSEIGDDAGIMALRERVRSGDPTNVEAQAARRYWKHLFSEWSFRRDRDERGLNAVLNYGYAVLRAMTARAVCGAGLHPSIGLHHHNRYSQFVLADDLMEPFRVVVDRCALELARENGPIVGLDRDVRRRIIEGTLTRFPIDGERRTLFDILARTATSLVAVFAGERPMLDLPNFASFFPETP